MRVKLTALVLTALALAVPVAGACGEPAPAKMDGLPACAAEDGPGPCYWDAKERGNGEGRSFNIYRDGSIAYWTVDSDGSRIR